jgi:hypothetical protein
VKQAEEFKLRHYRPSHRSASRRSRIETIPHAFGFRPGIDLDKLNQLVDELEAAIYAAGQRPGLGRGARPDRRQRPRSRI